MHSHMAARSRGTPSGRAAWALVFILPLAVILAAGCAAAPSPAAPPPPVEPALEGTPSGVKPADAEIASKTTAPSAMAVEPSKDSKADAAAAGSPTFSPTITPEGRPSPAGAPTSPSAARPTQSGLKAGYSDDNEQFNYFVAFLEKFRSTPHVEMGIRERIIIKVADSAGKPVANALVRASAGGRPVEEGRTYADGSYSLYPLDRGEAPPPVYRVEVSSPSGSASFDLDRQGPRTVQVRLEGERSVSAPLPVDILFVMDTTGSMGEEIERLRSTIEIIYANIAAMKPKTALRFGMVLYKDRGDEYVTRVVPFTSDLGAFQRTLDGIGASGGGDTPEDLQSALRDSVRAMAWNETGLRLGFVVTDAPAHLDYGQDYDYAAAAREAKAKAIKLFTIGTGGLPLEGEYLLRQIAQYTQGKYIFLTYGESGEAEGGREGSVSHHSGSNFVTDKLEAVVIRFVRDEIARQSDLSLEEGESYYAARKVGDESREEVLSQLFSKAFQDLSDFSSLRVGPETRCAIMPLSPAAGQEGLEAQAEYFGAQLALAAAKAKLFSLVERRDLQTLLSELELQLSALGDESSAAKVGKLLGAEVLVTGRLFRKDGRYELFLELVRVETAEVLSLTKARIDLALGL